MFGRSKKVRLERLPDLGAPETPAEGMSAEGMSAEGIEVDLVADLHADSPAADDVAPPAAASGSGGRRRGRRSASEGSSSSGPVTGIRPLVIALVVVVLATGIATLVQQPAPTVAEGATTVEPIGSSTR